MLFSTKSIAHGLPRDNITHSITYKAGDPKPTKSGAEPIHILLNQADKNRCFFPITHSVSLFFFPLSFFLVAAHISLRWAIYSFLPKHNDTEQGAVLRAAGVFKLQRRT